MHNIAVKILSLILCVSLGACSTRPPGLMKPLEIVDATKITLENTQKVDLMVVTNRAESPNPNVLYSGIRAEENSYRNIEVSIPAPENRKAGRIQWPKKRTPDPAKNFATLSVNKMTEGDVAQWFSQKADEHDGNFLIFVHGFNTPYDGGVYLLAQIVHDSGMADAPILFSWPSRGKVMSYDYDRESATYSRSALASLIDRVSREEKVKHVTIFAHSMGSWITMEALRTIKLRDGKLSPKLTDIILASPDIDVTVFRNQFNELGANAPPITLLTSKNDEALKMSRIIGGNIDRVGLVDFTKEPYKTAVNQLNLRVIDVSEVKGGGPLEHLKFSESPQIVKLIGESLINGQKLSESEVDFNEQLGILITGGAKEIVRTVSSPKSKKTKYKK